MNPAPLPTIIPHIGDLQPWAQSMFYATGQRVAANGNIYQCVVQGTSSGAGTGPAGGGAGIADGTATWNFQAAISAAWTALTGYTIGDVVTNDGGKLYVALNTETSGNSGGPTGTGGAIGDGGMVWAYTTTAVAQQTQPTSRTGDIGLVPGSKLFAQYENWWKALVIPWLYYLRDLAADTWTWAAAHIFLALVTLKEEATLLIPQLKTTNNGNVWRSGFDHIGFPSAKPIIQWHESWHNYIAAATSAGPLWSGSPWTIRGTQLGTGSITTGASATATYASPSMQLQAGNANADNLYLMTGIDDTTATGGVFIPSSTTLEFAVEWLAALSLFVTNSSSYFMGFCPLNTVDPSISWTTGGTPSGFFFRKLSGNAKWDCITGAGAGAQVSTLVGPSPANNEFHRFRIEFHGSAASGYSSDATVRYFIDDALVATHVHASGNWPTLVQRFGFGCLRGAGGQVNTLVAGGVFYQMSPLDI